MEEDISLYVSNEEAMSINLRNLHSLAKVYKPKDKSEQDRRYAIFITDLEKLMAYYDYWIVREGI